MKEEDSAIADRRVALHGLVPAALGVVAFSFTFPATVAALRGFDPYLVGIGRAAVAGFLAAGCLAAVRAPMPRVAQWRRIAVIAAGGVFGFPVLTALALDHGASSAHAAVVIGLLPASTAVFAALRAGERPAARFWLASGAGAVAVTVFALSGANGESFRLALADVLLFGALVSAGLAYAEGGRLAREIPGWRVIAWALVLSLPVTVPVSAVLLDGTPVLVTGAALLGFGYVSLVSMFLGFVAWYRGLATAGVARASQLQLAQPLLTVGWSVLFLGERVGVPTLAAALAVLACVAFTQRAGHRTADVTHPRTPWRTLSQRSR